MSIIKMMIYILVSSRTHMCVLIPMCVRSSPNSNDISPTDLI